MADKDITELIFQISQRGTAQAIKEMDRLEDQVQAAAKQYLELQKNAEGSGKDAAKAAQGLVSLLRDVERQAANASKNSLDIFGAKQLRKHEDSVRNLQVRYNDLLNDLTHATAAGDKALESSVRGRMRSIEQVATAEIAAFNRVYQTQKGKFDELINTEKQSLASLTKDALMGGGSALQALRGGDLGGVFQMGAGGIKGLGKQAGARAVAMGGAEAGGAAAGLASFARVAGPLALLVGTLGAVVKLFFDLDSGIKSVNRSMLKNVPLTQLASQNYGGLEGSLGDAKAALKEFQKVAMTDVNLRMLGLNEEDMGPILASMHEAGLQLGQLTDQGVGYAEALEKAQTAALLLGVDANEAAGLIGQLTDTTALSFDQASAALVQIVAGASEAGISSKKFFGTIQNLVGEMGLYNYKIAESVGLFTDLNQVLDERSAQQFMEQTETQFKSMSAEQRMTSLAIIAQGEGGIKFLADAVERAMKHLVDTLDPDKLRKAFDEIGKAELFDQQGFAKAVSRMSAIERDQLYGALDKESKQLFSRYLGFVQAKEAGGFGTQQGMMQMQGLLPDMLSEDKLTARMRALRGALGGRSLDEITSLQTEGLPGVAQASEDELRMLRAVERQRRADLKTLKDRAQGGSGFAEFAKGMGYNMTPEDILSGRITTENLSQFKTPLNVEKAAEEQRDYAKESADLQRDLTDTIKNNMMGWLREIHLALLEIHEAITNWSPFSSSAELQRKGDLRLQRTMSEEERALAQKERAGEDVAKERERLAKMEAARKLTPQGTVFPGIAAGREQAVKFVADSGATTPDQLKMLKEAFADFQYTDLSKNPQYDKEYFAAKDAEIAKRMASFKASAGLSGDFVGPMPPAQKAYDARILKRGIPMLDFQAGDIVVDRESLADAVVGGRGAFVPSLLDQAGAARGGTGKTLNANFYIYGGDSQEVRSTVLRVIEEWERKRAVS